MRLVKRIQAGLLLVIVVLGVAVFAEFSQQEEQQSEAVLGYDAYQELMALKVSDVYDLADWFFRAQDFWMVLLPPDPEFILHQSCSILPFEWKNFPAEFVENLVWEYENSVPVYPITIFEDFDTRETVFLNGDGREIFSLAPLPGYDPFAFLKWYRPNLYSGIYSRDIVAWYEAMYDPARVRIDVKLIPPEHVELYLYVAARLAEEEAARREEEEDGGGMLLRGGDPGSNLWVSIQGPNHGLTNIVVGVHLPDGFTNRIELFTCTNLLDSWWTLAATNLSTEGTNVVYWTYDLSGDGSPVFFAAGNADVDSDGDGLPDAHEKFLYGTDPHNWDTDGDGISDGQEILDGTDPLDKYSVRPPDMLRTEGGLIVDEADEPVILKSVNIGGWLAFEQWMMGFEPKIVTNMIGQVSDNHMPEATLRELLVDNVDFAVTRLATNHNGASGVSINGGSMSHVGNFSNGNWIRYDADFGTGVSNFSVVIARGVAGGNPRIRVHLGAVGGPIVGVLPVAETDTGNNWYRWSEQSVRLSTGIAGVTSVFLVGESSAGDIGNVHRVRFCRDTNTRGLFDTFRDNYFTTNDLDNLKALGYNSVRVPFLYDLIQDGTGTNYLEEGWARLDWVIDECAKRRMWVILDLHGTPGAQNGSDHSGKPKGLGNRLWSSVEYKNRLAHLWKTVAARYATNSAVAGYDLFNEPDPEGAGTKTAIYSNSIMPVLDMAYKAIRSNDTQHIVFMMSNFMYTNMWNDIWACPAPAAMGWSNVVYQFHHYDRIVYGQTGSGDFDFENQKPIADEIVRTYTRFSRAKNVPVFIGEFMPVEMPNFDYFIRRFEANNIHWAHWNYRHWGHDDSRWPWSSWGLDFRTEGVRGAVNTNIQPNVKTDSFAVLSDKFARYHHEEYTQHPYLPKVVRNHALDPSKARTRTEFYLNTFSGPDVFSLTDDRAWPWRKIAGVGQANRFWIIGQKAQVYLDAGPLVMRFQSRPEADARFEINDDMGCWFSFEPWTVNVTNEGSGSEAELRLSVVRDEITSCIYTYDTFGLIVRVLYEKNGSTSNVTLYVHAKSGGSNNYGTQLYGSSAIGFVPGTPVKLFVNSDTAILVYGSTTNWTGAHGLDLGAWPDGAVAAVEAEDPTGSRTWFVEMDNFRAWRTDAEIDEIFSEDFSAYPDGMAIRAEPEYGNVRRWTSNYAESYATNGSLYWIPQRVSEGGSWYSPRRNYQKELRLALNATNIIEFQFAYSAFSNGIARVCMLPESFPGQIYDQYAGTALYLQMTNDSAGEVVFELYKHSGPGGNRTLQGRNGQFAHLSGQTVTFQVSSEACRIWYGTNVVVNQNDGNATNWLHGITNALDLYAEGVYPHFEFLNQANQNNAAVRLDELLIRQRSVFSAP